MSLIRTQFSTWPGISMCSRTNSKKYVSRFLISSAVSSLVFWYVKRVYLPDFDHDDGSEPVISSVDVREPLFLPLAYQTSISAVLSVNLAGSHSTRQFVCEMTHSWAFPWSNLLATRNRRILSSVQLCHTSLRRIGQAALLPLLLHVRLELGHPLLLLG